MKGVSEMFQFIHIPQGTSGILIEGQSNQALSGLFTSGFSTCNIVAFISQGRIALLHFDWYTELSTINDILMKMGSTPKVHIIHRDTGRMIKEKITLHLQKNHSHLKPEFQSIPDTLDGICLFLKPQVENNTNSQIKILPTKGKHVSFISIEDLPNSILVRHPQEREFLAVRKMEQLIGVKARHATLLPNHKYKLSTQIVNKGRSINPHIYDGQHWLPMITESRLDETHPMTKEEIDFMRQNNKCYVALISAIGGIVQSNGGFYQEDIKDAASSIGFWAEDYLRKEISMSEEQLLRRNLQDALTARRNDAKTGGEREFIAAFQVLLQENASPTKLQKCIETLKTSIDGKNFAYYMCDEFKTAFGHYLDRQIYIDYQLLLARKIKASNQAYEQGLTAIREMKYDAGIELFKESLKLAHETLFKGDMKFIDIHYRLALCYFKINQLANARHELICCESLIDGNASKNFQKQLRHLQEEITAVATGQSAPLLNTTNTDKNQTKVVETTLKP